MLTGNALLAALEILPQQRLRGEFWRVVTASSLLGLEIEAGRTTVTRRFPDWLYAGGPTLKGGRYTPIGGPMTLYVASSEQAANAEWSAGLRALFPDVPLPPKFVFSIDVLVTRVLDLSDKKIRSALGTTQTELQAPWKALKQPATQRLGSAVFASHRFSAIRYRSTKAHRSHCLAIFPDRLLSPEHVNVNDPQGLILPG